ncbi:hypothetical protein JW872_03475 [Candidatus Babeliales bacterium]|nr:hypothetical protein [Candidatus Babeliales bacterium]
MAEDLCLSSTELYDNYGYWFVPFWKTWWFFGIIVFVSCLLIIPVVRYLLRFRRRVAYAVPRDEALAQLHVLVTNNGEVNDLYVMLTNVLREYVHKQHQLDVMSVGDRELEAVLAELGRENTSSAQLSELLQRVGTLKFSGESGSAEQYAQDVNVVRQWILADKASGETI